MVLRDSILVSLVRLVDRIPMPPAPRQRRGRPQTYSTRLLLKARMIMIIRRRYTAWALLAFLEQPDRLARQLRDLLTEQGRFPSRRTWERRLQALPSSLPGLIGGFGRYLARMLRPWEEQGRGVAVDSTALRAHGGVWHKKHREQGIVPHTSIDTEAAWSKSGWHGWWYGWKLHVVVTLGRVWIPLAGGLTAANHADNEIAPLLFQELPLEVRYGLGDQHDNTPEFRTDCALHNRERVATRRGVYPHTDGGWRCDASSTGCARKRLNPSTSCSRTSSSGVGRCQSRACSAANGSPWVLSSCINWFCSINMNTICL